MPRQLTNMVVVITGASAGIGRALAIQLAQQKAHLVLAARRLDRLNELNHQLGGHHLAIRTDVANPDDCRSLIDQTIHHFGRIDTLVCNAGYGIYRPVVQTDGPTIRNLFQTNVMGTTDCIYYAMPYMQQQPITAGYRSQVMIVSSAAARRGTPYIGVYSATKAAQLAIAEALRVELQPQHIAVTSIHPIMTATEFRAAGEALGDIRLPQNSPWVSQTADRVAAKMLRAIINPRPEVWPYPLARWLLGIGTLFPSLIDCAMQRYRAAVERHNLSNEQPPK